MIGVFSAASSTGQLVFLPAIAQLADGPGWRWAAALVTVFALALVPLVLWLLRDHPADVGTTAYGASRQPDAAAPRPTAPEGAARVALTHPAGEHAAAAPSGSSSARSGSAAGRPTG